jgi:phage-related holin
MRIADMSIDTSAWGWIKSASYFLALAVSAAITYIGVEHKLIYTLTGLMVVDWITGVVKARRLKIDVTSKRSNKGIIEKMMLLLIPVAIAVTLKAVEVPIGITMKAAFTLITVAELFSVVSNCYCIYTKTDVKEYDAVTAVIRFLRNTLMKGLKGFLADNNKGNQQNNDL